MAAFTKFNARGVYDEREAPFSALELEAALVLRQHIRPDRRATKRQDRCPHTPMCLGLEDCVDAIAWYLRHRRVVESEASERA